MTRPEVTQAARFIMRLPDTGQGLSQALAQEGAEGCSPGLTQHREPQAWPPAPPHPRPPQGKGHKPAVPAARPALSCRAEVRPSAGSPTGILALSTFHERPQRTLGPLEPVPSPGHSERSSRGWGQPGGLARTDSGRL